MISSKFEHDKWEYGTMFPKYPTSSKKCRTNYYIRRLFETTIYVGRSSDYFTYYTVLVSVL